MITVNYEIYRIIERNIGKYAEIFNAYLKEYFKTNNDYIKRIYDLQFSNFYKIIFSNHIRCYLKISMISWENIMKLQKNNFKDIKNNKLIEFANIEFKYKEQSKCWLDLNNLIKSAYLTKANINNGNKIFYEIYQYVAEFGAFLKDIIIQEIAHKFDNDIDLYLNKLIYT